MGSAILCIEDNQNNQRLIESGLSKDYELTFAENCSDAETHLTESIPDLILLDVNIPGKDGYQFCEELRNRQETASIPIIFVSGLTSLEDRLRGYRAGGDDYICKPVDIKELKSKINIHLDRTKAQKDLQTQLESASSTAMLAMTTSGEIGAVLNFIIETYHCSDTSSLVRDLFKFLNMIGLKGCVQIRQLDDNLDFSSDGEVSPIESQILNTGSQAERIVTVSNKTVFNEANVTLLIKNMPLHDPDLFGRMKDNLAMALKGVQARVNTLRLEESSRKKRNEKLTDVVRLLRDQMMDLDHYFGGMYRQIQHITEDLINETEDRLIHMGLSEKQEQEMLEILKESSGKISELNDHSMEIDSRFLKLEASLIEATLM